VSIRFQATCMRAEYEHPVGYCVRWGHGTQLCWKVRVSDVQRWNYAKQIGRKFVAHSEDHVTAPSAT
jgi:hypothetical protein